MFTVMCQSLIAEEITQQWLEMEPALYSIESFSYKPQDSPVCRNVKKMSLDNKTQSVFVNETAVGSVE